MKRGIGMAAALLSAALNPARAQDNALSPFAAHYEAYWKSINVGVSDLALRVEPEANHYYYTWTVGARGVFKILYSDEVKQQSWLRIVDDHVLPQKYIGEEGASQVSLQFDWEAGRVQGKSENKPVDLKVDKGVQDIMSIQVEVMLDLKNGHLPKTFKILEKDQLKEFNYSNEGPAKIKTALGDLDTIAVTSQRTGNNRLLRMWFAPALGYMPVQAERSRDGKLEFAMRIRSVKR